MRLTNGSKLGPYRILAPIGAGGMGEVYKAKDTRLDRTVAIKVLPSHLSGDAERRQRFEREARAVSSLNHPHICTLYDIGEQDGTDFIVMEYIEGESLADRLKKGALPLDQALRHGIQIADALDKAHRQGVVHRDLKPGNIMLTKSGAKLLDFGLAKLKASAPEQDASVLSALPTEEKPLTEKGSILGTFQYMAPEQLEGKDADARTDIFAFGSVLYEMVTGRRAFQGKSQASLIGAIMEHDPPAMSTLQSMSPPALDHVVKTCLAKDPDERWQNAGDVEHELKWIAEDGSTIAPAVTKTQGWRRMIPYASTAITVGLVVALTSWSLFRPEPQRLARLVITAAPADGLAISNDPNVTISPDGSHIVYGGESDGVRQLYVRPIDQLEATPLANTEVSHSPFFSPDGHWVGFFYDQDRTLRKVRLTGGPSVTICDAPGTHHGAAWGADDTIVFSSLNSGLARVSASGGTPEVLTTPDPDKGEVRHEFPEVLPGGKGVLFTIRTDTDPSDTRIAVLGPDKDEHRILIEGGNGVRFSPTGHLIYGQAGVLMAVPFDLARLETTGAPIPIVENVMMTTDGPAAFTFSLDGTLVYVGASEIALRTLVWVDREGREEPLKAESRTYFHPRISPDGTRVALDIRDQEEDIWIWDFARETMSRLTFDSARETYPLWTPDGQRVVFSSERGGAANLFWKAADGTGAVERLTDSPNSQYPQTLALDGKQLVYVEVTPEGGRDIRVLSLEGERSSKELLATTEFNERNGEVSPDGRWLAYQSNESGQDEVYVRPFPNVNEGRWQISSGGGTRPLWGPAGRELFYLNSGGRLMVVPVQTNPDFTAGSAEVLFEESYYFAWIGRTYDISPDGRRFLMIKESEQDRSMTVVLNWFEELKRLVPTEN